MTKLTQKIIWPLKRMSALRIAAIANVAVIVLAEVIAVGAWYALYGVFGAPIMITAAITLIASSLPLITLGIYMMKRLDETNRALAESKIELKQRASQMLRQKEEQLGEASERLNAALEDVESANHKNANCMALISHEVRTPLNAIIGCSEAMQRQTFGPIGSAKYQEFTDTILESGRHLLAVINDVFEMSKIEGGAETLHEEEFELGAFLRDVETMMADLGARHDIKFDVTSADGETWVWADPVKLRQILLNLMTNAMKYTSSGDTCRLDVEYDADGGLEIHVVDSGSAVPQHGIDDEPAPNAASAGFGLPLSRALAELHGGQLNIRRESDSGSRVVVTLPASRVIDHCVGAELAAAG